MILVVLGTIEGLRHRRNLARIPIRIHVNGTRGKSSVTRLIAAGLRAGGIATCAKTTGTEAAMILPDASEYGIYRPAGANIIEQVRIVDTAAEINAQALVVECMALQPLLQSLSELKLIRATHGVITNAREDHLDIMGPSEDDVALALAGSTPENAKMFIAENRHSDVFQSAADDRGTELITISPEEIESVSDGDLEGFSYLEHRENVALALRICADLDVDRNTALQGMWAAPYDPGMLTVHKVDFFERELFFANAFAANDPESTAQIWHQMIDLIPRTEKRIALFNCRIDRPDRSRQLGEACIEWAPADHYVLMGSGTYLFARAATARGLDVRKLVIVENQKPDEIFEAIVEYAARSATIVGMGNIHGGGHDLARLFRNRGTQKDLRTWT